MLPCRARVDLGAMAMKRCSIFPKEIWQWRGAPYSPRIYGNEAVLHIPQGDMAMKRCSIFPKEIWQWRGAPYSPRRYGNEELLHIHQGDMAMKGCSIFPKEIWQWRGAPYSPRPYHCWDLTIRLFNVISRTLVWGVITPLHRCSQCILSPRQLEGYLVVLCIKHLSL